MNPEGQPLVRLSPKDRGEVTRSESLITHDLKKHGEDLITEYGRTKDAQGLDLDLFLADIEDIAALDGPDQPRFAPALTSMGMDPIIRNAFITRLANSQDEYEKSTTAEKFQRELWLAAILRLDDDGNNPAFKENSAVVARLLEEFLTQEPATPGVAALTPAQLADWEARHVNIGGISADEAARMLEAATETEEVMKPVIKVGGYSEGRNPNFPDMNEDSMFFKTFAGEIIAGVFGGVGGSRDGRAASRKAAEVVEREMSRLIINYPSAGYPIPPIDFSNTVLAKAEEEIVALNGGNEGAACTTASIVHVIHHENDYYQGVWASVGDSRVYIYEKETGELKQISKDQSRVSDKVNENDEPLPGQEAFYYANRHFVGDVLGSNQRPSNRFKNMNYFEANSGDLVLLLTDGVTDVFTRPQLEAVIKSGLATGRTPQQISEALVKMTRDDWKNSQELSRQGKLGKVWGAVRGKKQQPNPRAKLDDATAIIIQLGSEKVKIPLPHPQPLHPDLPAPEEPPPADPNLLAFARVAKERNIQPLPGGDWMLVPDGAVKINSFQEESAMPEKDQPDFRGNHRLAYVGTYAGNDGTLTVYAGDGHIYVGSQADPDNIAALAKAGYKSGNPPHYFNADIQFKDPLLQQKYQELIARGLKKAEAARSQSTTPEVIDDERNRTIPAQTTPGVSAEQTVPTAQTEQPNQEIKPPDFNEATTLFGENSPFVVNLEEEARQAWEEGGEKDAATLKLPGGWEGFLKGFAELKRQRRTGITGSVEIAEYQPKGISPKGLGEWVDQRSDLAQEVPPIKASWIREPEPGATIAIKVGKLNDSSASGQLSSERWALLQLNNLFEDGQPSRPPKLLGYGVSETGQPYLVLEYIGGNLQPLSDFGIERGQALPPTEAVEIILKIGLILSIAHQHNIAYNDIGQPENFFWDRQGRILRQIDWGNSHKVIGNVGPNGSFSYDRSDLGELLLKLLTGLGGGFNNLQYDQNLQRAYNQIDPAIKQFIEWSQQGYGYGLAQGTRYHPDKAEDTQKMVHDLGQVLQILQGKP